MNVSVPSGDVRNRRRRHPASALDRVSIGIALVLATAASYPMARVLTGIFRTDGRWSAEPLRQMVRQSDLFEVLGNTVIVAGSATIAALVIGSALAWLNERTDARIGVLTDTLPLLPFMLPPVAGAIAWVLMLSDRSGLLNHLMRRGLEVVGVTIDSGPLNIFSVWGLIFVYTLYAIPYVYLLVSASLRNVDPSLEEQARVAGSGPFKSAIRVTLPSIRTGLAAALVFVVWANMAMYSVPAILGGGSADIPVVSTRIVNLARTFPPQLGVSAAMSLFIIFPVAVSYILMRRVLAEGRHAQIGGKGFREARIPLGRWRPVARAIMLGYVLLAVVLPVAALAIVSLSGYWTPTIQWSELGFDAYRGVLENPQVQQAIRNSLNLATVGATVGVLIAALVARLVAVRRSRGVSMLDGAIRLPAILSGVVIGVGTLLAYSGPPFSLQGTTYILLLGYMVVYLPQATVAADSAYGSVGGELIEASAISGQSSTGTFLRISLPLMAGGLAGGWSLLFARMAQDLTISSILAGSSNPVVGQMILEIYSLGSFARLAAFALMVTLSLSLVIGTAMWASTRVGVGRSTRHVSVPTAVSQTPPLAAGSP